MFEVYPSNWPVAVDANDPRNQFHRTALAEARFVTERREVVPAFPPRTSVVARLRVALAGGPATTEPCTCPA